MRSKIMVLAILVSGVILGAGALLGCGTESATEYDFSWQDYRKKNGLDSKRDELGVYLFQVFQSSKSAEVEAVVIPEIGAIWYKAMIEMTEVQQDIAGALDVMDGVVQGVTNRVLCLTELGVRVLPEISQGLLDDYGSDSAEGACKLGCVTNAALPAALWCMAYPENFGSNSEFDPDTLWQEIDSYLHATCDDITAHNGCVPYY